MPRFIASTANTSEAQKTFGGAEAYLIDTGPDVETPPNTIAVFANRALAQVAATALNEQEES